MFGALTVEQNLNPYHILNTPLSTLLSQKPFTLLSVAPETSVQQAVELMNEKRVGSVLIIRDQELVGIFTERDVLRRIVAASLNAAEISLSEVMTSQILTVTPDTEVGHAMDLVNENKVRHLPVVDKGRIVGLISAGDLNRHMTETFRQEAGTLMSYISDNGFAG